MVGGGRNSAKLITYDYVEQFFRYSVLYSFHSGRELLQASKSDARLRDHIDFEHFDLISHEQGLDALADFLENSPRSDHHCSHGNQSHLQYNWGRGDTKSAILISQSFSCCGD